MCWHKTSSGPVWSVSPSSAWARTASSAAVHSITLEAVGGHDQRLGGGVVAVVRPSDPLHQALDVLGGADLDHEVHIPPVDPEVERAGADDCLETTSTIACSTFSRCSRASAPW